MYYKLHSHSILKDVVYWDKYVHSFDRPCLTSFLVDNYDHLNAKIINYNVTSL